MIFKICYDHIYGSKIFIVLYFVILSQKIFEYTFFISNQVSKSWSSDLAQKLSNSLATLQAEMKKVKQLKPKFEKIPAFVGILFLAKNIATS